MKKVRVTITQELELPDHCEVVNGPDAALLKLCQLYLSPGIEFMQSNAYSPKGMTFVELDEATTDAVFGAIVHETRDIREV